MWDDDYGNDYDRYEERCIHEDEWEDEDEDDGDSDYWQAEDAALEYSLFGDC